MVNLEGIPLNKLGYRDPKADSCLAHTHNSMDFGITGFDLGLICFGYKSGTTNSLEVRMTPLLVQEESGSAYLVSFLI